MSTTTPPPTQRVVPARNDFLAWLLAILRDIALIVFVIVYVIHTV